MYCAVLVLLKRSILKGLKLGREVVSELQYLLKEVDPLDVANVNILEPLHDIVDFLGDLLDQLLGGVDPDVLREPAILDHVDVSQLLQGDLEVLNRAVLQDVEPREPGLNFIEAQLDLLFHLVDEILECCLQQVPVVGEEGSASLF